MQYFVDAYDWANMRMGDWSLANPTSAAPTMC
jgi:hypothetical protein